MSEKKNPPEEAQEQESNETFYDAQFSIEAMQNEPYEGGFTWRSVVGAFFIAFVMLPGVIFMGLMIGQDLGTAADWVTIILFVELARRSFIVLRKQELYILKYTVSQLSHLTGGLALGGGVFAHMIFHRYLAHSQEFAAFGISHQVPDWYAPMGDGAYDGFWNSVWFPVIAVLIGSMVLSKLVQLSLGYLAYKMTSDVEKLPFPLAPIHAEGAIALAESSQDKRKKGYRQYCFSIGVICGAAFGLVYIAIPVITGAFGKPIQLIPIPFVDFTQDVETILPSATVGISLNLALLFTGFVLPWRIVIGMTAATLLFQVILNPILFHYGLLTSWAPGKDAIETHVANTIDLYLSVGIGTAFAVFFVGLFGIGKALIKYSRDKKSGQVASGGFDIKAFFHRDKERGDPPLWVPVVVFVVASGFFVLLCDHLINHGVPEGERFHVGWLIAFAFFWTPINTYINARMSGIAGQHAGVPFVTESAIFVSGYNRVAIWLAPLPIHNYGQMADLLRETQLTRTRFTSILKAELLIFPLLLFASFIFWNYIQSLGNIPSEDYPYAQKMWPQFATLKALWASSMQEGSLLFNSLKPEVIVGALVLALGMFGGFAMAGVSAQYAYGGIAALNSYPHMTVMVFTGAVLGRYVLARKFGKERWTNFAPILAVGFMAGMGLIGMLAIAFNFLWVSVGTTY